MKINTNKDTANKGKKNFIPMMPAISLNSMPNYILHFKYIDNLSIRKKSFKYERPSPSSREILIYR